MTHQPLCLNDITIFPPPCLTAERAKEIYSPAFQRIVEYAVNSRIEGDVFEFGTFNGYTARTLAELMYAYKHQGKLRLYDSWEGFPAMEGGDANCPEVVQHKTWNQGDCRPIFPDADIVIGKILNLILPQRVHCVKGFYDKTFTGKCHNTPIGVEIDGNIIFPSMKASIVHIDCDLYESTKYVLEQSLANDVLAEGAVIMFDDWNNNFGSNKYGERAAVRDVFQFYYDCGIFWNKAINDTNKTGLSPWFSYGSSGMAFIVQKA